MSKIAATLILATLVAHSAAFFIKKHSENDLTIEEFTYSKDDLTFNSSPGRMRFPFFGFSGMTPLVFNEVNGVKSINQTTLLPGLEIFYDNAKSVVDKTTDEGYLNVCSLSTLYNLTLAASAPGAGECKLEITVTLAKEDISMWFCLNEAEEDIKAEAIKSWPVVMEKVNKLLNKGLPEYFGDYEKEFCEKLQQSTAENFPDPAF